MTDDFTPEESARLRRVLNRSAVIRSERHRRHRRFAAAWTAGALAVAMVAAANLRTELRRTVLPGEQASTDETRTTAAPAAPAGRDTWTSAVFGAGTGGIATGAGRVYAMASDRLVAALDARTGHILWTHPAGGEGPAGKTVATVDFAGGLVLAAGPDVPLQALVAESGTLAWTTSGTSPTVAVGGVAVAGGTVVAANDAGIAAFRVADGAPVWAVDEPGAREASAGGDLVVAAVGRDGGALLAADAATGTTRWRVTLPSPAAGRAAFFEGDPVVVDAAGRLSRLDRATGSTVYRVDAAGCGSCVEGGATGSQPTVVGSTVVVGTPGGVVAVDGPTGRVLWRHPTDSPVTSSPAPLAGRVAVGIASPPAVVELDAATGRERARHPLPAPPGPRVLAAGATLTAAAQDGRVHALRR
ncbi:MAG TPA: PQQ-binding-like beta-propeller repeat protein [Acidimicrobiales bacterium]|nr:PQQ-binding-like beta-propeller repeat protein [Acidimicrobiales bacterium]